MSSFFFGKRIFSFKKEKKVADASLIASSAHSV
jgi:hypothetical protein